MSELDRWWASRGKSHWTQLYIEIMGNNQGASHHENCGVHPAKKALTLATENQYVTLLKGHHRRGQHPTIMAPAQRLISNFEHWGKHRLVSVLAEACTLFALFSL